MKLRDLEIISTPTDKEQWSPIDAGGFSVSMKFTVIAAVAVEFEVAELSKAMHLGRTHVGELFAEAALYLKTGAQAQLQKWLGDTPHGGTGVTFVLTKPEFEGAFTSPTQLRALIIAVRGSMEWSAEDALKVLTHHVRVPR